MKDYQVSIYFKSDETEGELENLITAALESRNIIAEDIHIEEVFEENSEEFRDDLRDAGRNPDGSGESYAERNV